ncbi:hypothetical protein D9758_015682 [Tetrapyrgos nigripes]|uniref:FAD-binding domain-containing protein n=1 Tax=Tetrapyrgos nigripes TaxID=182062 RepID=A0A8H5C7R0_9AGAR|nr:hypothetical protein D9758_015682 [Tetrapyrgos nigripes]
MPSPVLIVGAGPSGLVLALTLLRNNVSSRTLEVYKFLGILPNILDASGPTPQIEQWVTGGKEPVRKMEKPVIENTAARPYNHPVMLGQNRHEDILRTTLENEYGCKVELGTEFISFEQHPDHVVVHMEKTIDARKVPETATFSFLIGADGARSQIRKQLGLSFLGETITSGGMLVGDLDIKGLDSRKDLQLGDTHGAMVLVEAIKDVTGRTDLQFGELTYANHWRPNIRMVNKFGSGRVFVTGGKRIRVSQMLKVSTASDAAHCHSPTGAQGMNSGVQDSFNLGWKLSLVYKGLSPTSLLDTYSEERLPVIATMLQKTTELYHSGFLVHTTFNPNTDAKAIWARGHELMQLGVNYRGSSLVVDQKPEHALTEENSDPYREDDNERVRFFDIFVPSAHTVVIFAGAASITSALDAILKSVAAYPKGPVQTVFIYPKSVSASQYSEAGAHSDYVLMDREGHAYRNYVASETDMTMVVVRPDGYVGAVLLQPEGLKAYFKKIFA